MKAALALIPDLNTQNFISQLGWEIHLRFGINVDARRLPPHISLKQSFDISDLAGLSLYTDELASNTEAFRVDLMGLQLIEMKAGGKGSGLLWMDVADTQHLRKLHEQLNRELESRFGNTQADHDGDRYEFHMTVAAPGQPLAAYKSAYAAFADSCAARSCRLDALALFVYSQSADDSWSFQTYHQAWL